MKDIKKQTKQTKKTNWGYILIGLLCLIWTFFLAILAIKEINLTVIGFMIITLIGSIGFLTQGWLFNIMYMYILKPTKKWISIVFWKSSVGGLITQIKSRNIEEKESGRYKLNEINTSSSGSLIAGIISIIFIIIIFPKWQNNEFINWYEYLGASIGILPLITFTEEGEKKHVTKLRYYLALCANFILKSMKWIVIAVVSGLLISWFAGLPPATIIIILLIILIFRKN